MNPSTVVMFSPRNLAQTFNKNNDSKSCKNNSNTSIMDACAITEASSTTCGEEEEDDDDDYDEDEEHEIVSYSRSTVEEHPLINDNIKICVPIAAAVDDYYEEEKGSCLSLPAVPIPTLETDNQQVQSLDLKQILQEMDAELDDLITKTKSTIEKSTTTASTALSCSFNSSNNQHHHQQQQIQLQEQQIQQLRQENASLRKHIWKLQQASFLTAKSSIAPATIDVDIDTTTNAAPAAAASKTSCSYNENPSKNNNDATGTEFSPASKLKESSRQRDDGSSSSSSSSSSLPTSRLIKYYSRRNTAVVGLAGAAVVLVASYCWAGCNQGSHSSSSASLSFKR